jgi:GT2 family glycosyltransferase
MSAHTDLELSVVVPTIDALSARVKRCVESVRHHTGAPHELLLLENRSPPQGFTAPVNAGIRAARGRYVAVLNDDVEVRAGWWPPLRMALDEGASLALPGAAAYNRDHFAAFCFAFRADAVTRLECAPGEFFDPELKLWFQDLDLLLRLLEAGDPPVVVRESEIVHYGGETVLSERASPDGWIERRIERDRAVFGEKWPGGRRGERAAALLSVLPKPKNEPWQRRPRSERAGKPPRE